MFFSSSFLLHLKQYMHVLDSNLPIYNSMFEPITGSFKHTSNTSQLETLNRNGAFELINLHVADSFFLPSI